MPADSRAASSTLTSWLAQGSRPMLHRLIGIISERKRRAIFNIEGTVLLHRKGFHMSDSIRGAQGVSWCYMHDERKCAQKVYFY
jgi:hypothetical protein